MPTASAAEDHEAARRRISEGLHGLAAVGLIDVDSGNSQHGASAITIAVHPVVADADRARLLTKPRPDLSTTGQAAVRLLQAASEELDPARPADWPAWRLLVPHINAMLEWLAAYVNAATLASLSACGVVLPRWPEPWDGRYVYTSKIIDM